jgi:hypothetical protein
MKKAICLIMIMLLSLFGMTQYPIKTIFKGDSVIILTIKQSEGINKVIEKNSKLIKESDKKLQDKDNEIKRLNDLLSVQNNKVDSINNEIRIKNTLNDSLLTELNNKKRIIEIESSLADSLWRWALGPTLIYTQYPDDDNVYLFDLSHYYMTTDDFGIMMAKMNERDYKKYREFIETYGLDETAIWKFKNEMNVEYLSKGKMEEKKVWKYKRKKTNSEK